MLTAGKLRTRVLITHGSLALCLGLIFLYLRATMTNPLFEAFAVVIAVVLSATAFILAAIADWFAALSAWMKGIHRVTFYLLAGIAVALPGISLGWYSLISMRWLAGFAAVHALAFAISAFAFAARAKHYPLERRAMYLFGAISVLFFAVMGYEVGHTDNRSATALLGGYLCFVGAKILFIAWNSQRTEVTTSAQAISRGKKLHVMPAGSTPANVSRP